MECFLQACLDGLLLLYACMWHMQKGILPHLHLRLHFMSSHNKRVYWSRSWMLIRTRIPSTSFSLEGAQSTLRQLC